MHYYRYSNAEVSCWYKYLLFSYNIVFWVRKTIRKEQPAISSVVMQDKDSSLVMAAQGGGCGDPYWSRSVL
ncbi:Tetraspanin-14 [Heterocephalus glaber]|uniref:Tetraspanin-14 n=1 Tax=Heterocephalus glaber TaxID=10181 RepID=G5BGY1_HETGA|nr:Tetraspanin-14 [Heterocephalus glaber]